MCPFYLKQKNSLQIKNLPARSLPISPFSYGSRPPPLDDTEVKEVSTFKFLGINVDRNLTRKNHVDDLAKKCSHSTGILHKVKQFLPESALLSLYSTLFLSHINYDITAWSSANSVDKDRLHVLQKRALRAVNNSEYRSHSNPLFIKYNHKVALLPEQKFRFLLKSDILQSLIHRFWNWKNHSNRTYGCRDIDCQSPGNQQLWQQLSFYFLYFF